MSWLSGRAAVWCSHSWRTSTRQVGSPASSRSASCRTLICRTMSRLPVSGPAGPLACPVVLSESLANQDWHPVAARHDAVVVAGRLADHVDARRAALIVDEQAANALADLIPDAVFQTHRRRDVDRLGVATAPAARLDGRQPGPAGTGQPPALAATIAPRYQPQVPFVPDRQDRRVIAEQELDLAFAAALVDTTAQVILFEDLQRQRVPG